MTATDKMRSTLFSIARRIRAYDMQCDRAGETDTGDAWDLMRKLQRDAERAARAKGGKAQRRKVDTALALELLKDLRLQLFTEREGDLELDDVLFEGIAKALGGTSREHKRKRVNGTRGLCGKCSFPRREHRVGGIDDHEYVP